MANIHRRVFKAWLIGWIVWFVASVIWLVAWAYSVVRIDGMWVWDLIAHLETKIEISPCLLGKGELRLTSSLSAECTEKSVALFYLDAIYTSFFEAAVIGFGGPLIVALLMWLAFALLIRYRVKNDSS